MNRLKGARVLVTRSRQQAPELATLLEQEGAIVYEAPAIRIVKIPQGVADLAAKLKHAGDYDWLLLTSVNSVKLLNEVFATTGNQWSDWKIGCIGTATAKKVEELGGSVSLVPAEFRAESLSAEIRKERISGTKILLPRAAGSRTILPNELRAAGAIVDEIHIYLAEIAEDSKEALTKCLQSGELDYITFTSSSTVRNFAELAGDLPWQTIAAACIGPITAETLREYGIAPAVEAKQFTMPGLVEAMANVWSPQ